MAARFSNRLHSTTLLLHAHVDHVKEVGAVLVMLWRACRLHSFIPWVRLVASQAHARACVYAYAILPDLCPLLLLMQVTQRIKGAISSKQPGHEDILGPLVAEACIAVCPKNPANFNVDNVRVCKIPGSGVHDCRLVRGVVIKRDTEGVIKNVQDAKVAVFVQGVDTGSTETKVSHHGASGVDMPCTGSWTA